MTRKKHEDKDESKKSEAGKAADNMDINSQDRNVPIEESAVGINSPDQQLVEVTSDEKLSEPEGLPAKEAIKVDETIAKLAEMQDKYLRLSAEFDNYRKRTLREKIELTKHAGENILISLIPVIDDFERALKSMESSPECASMKAGIDLIYNKFRDFLTQKGIKEIESLNTEFNVDLHEAMSKIPVEDENQKGKVVEVLQKGYYLHDKVMRHSKVVVGE